MAKHNDTSPEGRSVRVLRVGEQVRHVLSELLARGEVHDEKREQHAERQADRDGQAGADV